MRTRFYDPAIGRFSSRDLLPEDNRYVYAFNNPVNLSDPSGLCVPDMTCGISQREPILNKEGRIHWPTKPTPVVGPRPEPEGETCGLLGSDYEVPILSDVACSDEKLAAALGHWLDENTSEECRDKLFETWLEDTGIKGVETYYDLEAPQRAEYVSWATDFTVIIAVCNYGIETH